MESIGARLKEVRLGKGLSLEEVHKKTKIQMDILKAIEENSLANINPIYIKGFLKIYCDFLGVNFKEYNPDQKDSGRQPQQVSPRPMNIGGAAVPQKQPIKMAGKSKFNVKQAVSVLVIVLLALFLVVGLVKLGGFVVSAIRKPRHSVARPIPPVTVKPVVKAVAKPLVATKKVSAKQVPLTSKVRLAVSAKEDCFIQLKVDGKTVFQRVLKRGRFESWEAKDRIELSLNNAAALTMVVNGQSIPPIGRKGQAVKNIVITREGINTGR